MANAFQVGEQMRRAQQSPEEGLETAVTRTARTTDTSRHVAGLALPALSHGEAHIASGRRKH